MIELSVALVLLGGMALWGWRTWLDRVHPIVTEAPPTDSQLETRLLAKYDELRGEIELMKLGKALRGGEKPPRDVEDF